MASSHRAGQDLAVFVLTYSLAPGAAYPTQLTQAVEALRYILDETGRTPAQVLIGGDSAGGNLVMGVLSHLAHGHPAIRKLKVAEPLAGAVGIAPWTLIGEDHSGRDIYHGGDLITPAVDGPWSRAFLGGADKDYFTSASTAPRSWLAAFPVKRVLILGGGNEILLPAIEDLADNLKVRQVVFVRRQKKKKKHQFPALTRAPGRAAQRGVVYRTSRSSCCSRVQHLRWGQYRNTAGQKDQGMVERNIIACIASAPVVMHRCCAPICAISVYIMKRTFHHKCSRPVRLARF